MKYCFASSDTHVCFTLMEVIKETSDTFPTALVTHLYSAAPMKHSVQFNEDLQTGHALVHTHTHTRRETLDYSNPGTGGYF